LPETLAVTPLAAPFDAAIRPPGSKSLTNRALLLAALADGESTLHEALRDGEDAARMISALTQLGARIVSDAGGALRITGVGGTWKTPPEGTVLDLHNAGTATRFLAGAALLSPAPITLDGNARMRERPIGELGYILTALGCGVSYLGKQGCPPVRITPPAPGSRPPGVIDVPTTQSSQFISALLLVGPWLPGGITLRLTGEVTSASYIAMTLGLLARLSAQVRTSEDLRVLRVSAPTPPGETPPRLGLRGFQYTVEPDASGASYFWAAAAMIPKARCRVLGLGDDSLQGDSKFPEVLALMGAKFARSPKPQEYIQVTGPHHLKPILADMSQMPDAAMTLAAVACFAGGTSILRGLRTLRVKECDRIAALQTELAKVGVVVQTPVQGDPDAMTVTPPSGGMDCFAAARPVEFDTYNDHRIAMSLALIALRRPNTFIRNPACVAKTYPGFWADLAHLYDTRNAKL